MARKGNFSFDSDDDLGFGDEMFPIDDSAFDDSGLDFLEGLDGSTAKAKSGVGGFFKNAVKSVKGLGLDVVNEFVPAAIDLKDSVSFALGDVKSTLSEKKDWAAEKLGEIRSKKSDANIGAAIKDSFKATVSNIKQGKFYKSSLDMSDMDMNAFFNEDDDDEDEEYESEDADLSGVMTTAYKPTSKKKNARPVSVVNYNTDTQGMIEATAAIQQDAVQASAKISTRLANKQTAVIEQNFAIQRAYLQNISTNLLNTVNFLYNEGSTSLKAQLEYSAKSLAFMTDQNNLLKEQIKLANRQLGIDIEKMNNPQEDEDGKYNPFSGGSFDMSKYFSRIGKNAKDMFGGTTLGFGYDSLKQMQDLQKSMGMKTSFGDMAKSMMKSGVMGALFSNATKGKFEKINELVENFGFGLTAKANRMKNSNSPIAQFFGNLLGYDETVNKHTDMGIAGRAEEPVAFNRKTDMTINTVIPGQLNKIIQLLGGEGQYFDYKQGMFRTDASKVKEYKMAQQSVFDRDLEFSDARDALKVSANAELEKRQNSKSEKNKAYKSITGKDIESAFKLFQDNMVNHRITIGDRLFSDENNYTHVDENNPKVGNRTGVAGELAALFDGFDKFGNNKENVIELIRTAIQTMDGATISRMNRRVLRLGEELKNVTKQFKEESLLYGGSLALAKINQDEKFEAEDYDMKNSSNYNENHIANKNNALARNKAIANRIQRKNQQFYERGGVIDEVNENAKNAQGTLKGTAVDKIDQIYNLLLNGINVFPTQPSPEQSKFIAKAAQTVRYAEIERIAAKKQEEKDEEKMRNEMMKNAKQASIEKKARMYGGFELGAHSLFGIDHAANKYLGSILSPFADFVGMGDELREIMNSEAPSSGAVAERAEQLKAERATATQNLKDKLNANKEKGGIKGGIANIGAKAVNFVETTKNKIETKAVQNELKWKKEADTKRKLKFKKMPFWAELEGIKDVYFKFVNLKNEGKNVVKIYAKNITDEQKEKWMYVMNDEKMGITFVDELDPETDLILGKLTKGEEKMYGDMINYLGIKQINSVVAYEKASDLINSEGFVRYMINKEDRQKEYYKAQIENTANVSPTADIAFSKALSEIEKASGDKLTKLAKKSGVERTTTTKSGATITRSDAEMKNILKSKAKKTRASASTMSKQSLQANAIAKKMQMPKSLVGVNGSKAAYELFKKKDIENDINTLLASNNQDLILNFAESIKSKHDGFGPVSDTKYLNPSFEATINDFLADPEIAGKGVSIRTSIRSPLSQLAMYSVGRTDPEITEALLRKAGYTPENTSWYSHIMSAAKKGKTIADTLNSNHMKGFAVDIDNGNVPYKTLGKIAEEKYGITWGGNWSSHDNSHFEMGTPGGFKPKMKGPFLSHGKATGEAFVGPRLAPVSKQAMNKADIVDYFKADAPTESSADSNKSEKAENIKLSDNLKDSEYGKQFKGNKSLFLIHNRLLEIRDMMKDLSINTGFIGLSMGIPGLLKKGGKFVLDIGKGSFKFLKDKVPKLTAFARDVGEKAKEGINKVKNWAKNSDIIGGIKAKATNLKASVVGLGVSAEEIAKMKKPELVQLAVSKLGMSEEEAKAMKVDELRKLCINKAKNNLLSTDKGLIGSLSKTAGNILSTGKDMLEKGAGFATAKGAQFAEWGSKKASDLAGKLSEKFTGKNYFQKASDSIKDWLEDKKTKVEDIKAKILKDLEGKLTPEDIEKIKKWPKNKKGELIEFVKAKYDELMPSTGSKVTSAIGGFASGVAKGVSGLVGKITGGAGGGGGLFVKNKSLEIQMQTLAETRAIRMMLGQKYEAVDVAGLLSEIKSSIESGGSGGGIGKALGGIGKGLKTVAGGALGLAKDATKGIFGLTGKGIAGGVGLLAKATGGILGGVGKGLGWIHDKFLPGAKDKFDSAKEKLEKAEIGKKLKGWGSRAKEKLGDNYEAAKEFIGEKKESLKEKIKDSNLKDKALAIIGSDKPSRALDFIEGKTKEKLSSVYQLGRRMIPLGHSAEEEIVNGAKNNKKNERGQVEGSYEDQIADNKEEEQEKRDVEKTNVLMAIAGALGVKKYRNAADGTTVIDKVEEIDQNGEETNKALGKIKGSGGGGKGGLKEKLLSLGTTAGAAGIGLAAVGAVGAGVAAAGTAIKRVGGKIVDTFKHTKGGGFGQKINSLFGHNESQFNEDGTEKTDQEKKNSRARINLGSVQALGKYMGLVEKLIKKALTHPKISKLFGKRVGEGMIKGAIKMISQGMAKGAGKVAGKIASKVAQMTNPIGWGFTVAQAVAALVTGWTSTKRYFSLGKGIQPTIPMRITSAIVSLLSDFCFGLIPVSQMVNFIFNLTASDETKKGMEEGRAFVEKRAKILGVDSKRLTEYESQTIMERIFGNAQKWSNVLGFSKGNKDKAGVDLFKRWRDEKYKPLDDMMNDMVKIFGKKVLKPAANEDDARHQKKFREEYLKKAEAYVKEHKLEWLVAGCKAEDEFAKGKEDEKTTITEGEKDENNEATAEESKAVATSQTQATQALEASIPEPEKEEAPKVPETGATGGTATVAPTNTTPAAAAEKPKSLELGKEAPLAPTPQTPEKLKATAEESKAVATSQTQAQVVGGKVVSGNINQNDYEAIQRRMDLMRGQVYRTDGNMTYPVFYKWNEEKKYYEPDGSRIGLLGGSDEDIEEYEKKYPKYDANGYEVQADRWHGLNIGPTQDLASKLDKPRKKLSKSILGKAVNMAKHNIQRAIDFGTTIKESVAKKLSNTVFGRMASGAKNMIAGGAAKVASFFKKSGEKLLDKIHDFKSGLQYITENRVEVQNRLKEAIANGDTQGILDLIKRVKNKDMVGQQTTTDGLNPVMKERVEAFLNDPRVAGHGVRIRESIRPITSQIAYFLKGRAPNDVTDAVMKEAGFKYGINFWGKNFQKMGDTVTTTIGSNHFNGTAVDLEPGDLGYERLGEIAKEYGLEWGGYWQGFKDPPHFELDTKWSGKLPVNDDTADGTVKGNYQADSEGTAFDMAAKVSTMPKLQAGRGSSSLLSVTAAGYGVKPKPVSAVRKIVDNVTSKIAINGTPTGSNANNAGIAQLVSRAIETDRKIERGLAILEQISAEQQRHNKINEEQIKDVLTGISLIGKILTAGLSNLAGSGAGIGAIGNGSNLTNGVFDRLARGN